MTTGREDGVRLTLAGAALAGVTVALQLLAVSSPSTVSTTYLLIVLVVATTSRLRVAVITSIAAMLSLNFFFLPPIGNFTISDPENWGALVAFLAVSLVASHLSSVCARADRGRPRAPQRGGAAFRSRPRRAADLRQPRRLDRPGESGGAGGSISSSSPWRCRATGSGTCTLPDRCRFRSTRVNSRRHSRPR
jgi:hypothetical protein